MQNKIERKMTQSDIDRLTEDGIPGKDLSSRKLTSTERFEIELHKHEQEATKKGIPFARHAARDDFNREIKSQKEDQLRKYGRIAYPEKLTLPKLDWDKYSDLKNFELIETKERNDEHLTKTNPGLTVDIMAKVYRYKGYGNKYTIMESGPDAIARAVKKRAQLDKQIAMELS